MRRSRLWSGLLAVVAAAAVLIVVAIQPRFFSAENLVNVARQSTPLLVFSLAQMLPVLSRGLDLSQGGVVVATSVTFALAAQAMGTTVGCAAALAVGLAAGVANGLLISGIGVSPFVVTLGMGSALRGVALMVANGQPISDVPANFSSLFYSEILWVPTPLVVAVGLIVAQWLLLERVLIGRYVFAIGSNERAAYLSGIPVRSTLIFTYAVAGATTSLGSILLSSRIASGHPTAGADTALQAIGAAVIGGVSLFGGRGTVAGVVLGALFLTFLSNALNLLNVSSFLQLVVIGVAIVLAVVVDKMRMDR